MTISSPPNFMTLVHSQHLDNGSSDLNYISFGDFWVCLGQNTISFGDRKDSDKIHYTVSFGPQSDFYNFHISKNIGNINFKPKIEILRINKEELHAALEKVALDVVMLLLQPLSIKKLKRKYHSSLWYLPHPIPGSELEAKWHKKISSFSDRHGNKSTKRLKFKSDLGSLLRQFAEYELEPEFVFEGIQRVSLRYTPDRPFREMGTLLANGTKLSVIRIGKKWYKHGIGNAQRLNRILDQDTLQMIVSRFNAALESIRHAESYADTSHWNPSRHLSAIDIFPALSQELPLRHMPLGGPHPIKEN